MGIRKEPVLVNKLKARKLILTKVPRPFRKDILERMAIIGTKLRNPEFVGTHAASSILGGLFKRVGRIVGVRGQEPGEKRKTYPGRRTM